LITTEADPVFAMNLLLVGINHRTAPVEVRERMNIQEARLASAVSALAHRDGILEGMILSTCNRVELVTNARDEVEAAPILRSFLAEYHHCDLAPFEPHFYWLRQQDVVRHLFRVASSLDAMVLGEPQVLGQVKEAYATARRVGALDGALDEIVSRSLAVARRVRRETAIGSSAYRSLTPPSNSPRKSSARSRAKPSSSSARAR